MSRCDGVVYYESLKRELQTKTIYGFRYDERLKTKVEESTRLTCTLLCAELEHLTNVYSVCVNVINKFLFFLNPKTTSLQSSLSEVQQQVRFIFP